MTPTHTPALKIPSMAEQLLKHAISDKINGRYNFFMVDICWFIIVSLIIYKWMKRFYNASFLANYD
jgi:hypothetical protein